MLKTVLAFDCDDVLVSTCVRMVEHYNRLHNTMVRPEDFYSKDYAKIWKADQETAIRDLFSYLLTEEYKHLAPMDGAINVLKSLAKRYELYIVTGRPDSARQVTEQWVARYLPGIFKDVIFTNFFKLSDSVGPLRSKADVCEELGAKYLVDDHLHHIQNVSDHTITGLLFGNLSWEQTSQLPPGSIRIATWAELQVYFDQQA